MRRAFLFIYFFALVLVLLLTAPFLLSDNAFNKTIIYLSEKIHSVLISISKFLVANVGQVFEIIPRDTSSNIENRTGDRVFIDKDEVGEYEDDHNSSELIVNEQERVEQKRKENIFLSEIKKKLDEIASQVQELEKKILLLLQEEKEEEKEEEDEDEKDKEEKEEEKDFCPVEINTASGEHLQSIIGIGPVLAERIIAARPFYSLEDLLKVSGIGPITLQKIINQGCAYVAFTGPREEREPVSQLQPSFERIIISEVQIAGEETGHDFVEFYNPNDFDVDVSNYKLRKRSSTGTESSLRVFPSGSKIVAKGYYLWASSQDGNYPSLVGADTSSTQTLASNNSIALFAPDDTLLSALGWGSSTNPFVENIPFPGNPPKNKSLGRIWAEDKESYSESNNNSVDFEIQSPTPKSKNQSSFIEHPLTYSNLLSNEFFDEWEDNSPLFWNYSGTQNHILKSDDKIRGSYSLSWTPITSANNLTQTGISVNKPGTYYAEIWIKPVNVNDTNYIRVSFDIASSTDGTFPQASFTEYKSEVGWVKITKEREIKEGQNSGIRIRAERRGSAGPFLLIGAAWFGATPPPSYWPFGQPPEKVQNLEVSGFGTQVSLAWDYSTDPDTPSQDISYKIYYAKDFEIKMDDLDNSAIQTATTTENNLILSNLEYNSLYYFGVRAYDKENNFSEIATSSSYKTATLATIKSGFGEGFLINNNGRKIVRTSRGTIYTVYEKENKIFLASSEDGINWTEIPWDKEDGLEQNNPSLSIDSNDNLHLVWQAKSIDLFSNIFYLKYDGVSFSEAENLTENLLADCEIPFITIDLQDNVYIAWKCSDSEVGDSLYFLRNSGGAWDKIRILKEGFYLEGNKSVIPSFAFASDKEGILHFIWVENFPSQQISLRYSKVNPEDDSQNSGEFEELKILDSVGYPSIAIDDQNNVHIVLDQTHSSTLSSSILYFKHGGVWEEQVLFQQESQSFIINTSISIDSANNVYVVWKRWNDSSRRQPLESVNIEKSSVTPIKTLVTAVAGRGFPSLLWSIDNKPSLGYSFVFYDGTILKFYGSNDLKW